MFKSAGSTRRSRRLGVTVAAASLLGSLGGALMMAPGASAAPATANVKVTDAVPQVLAPSLGHVFKTVDVSLAVPAGATGISAVLSSTPDGTGLAEVDDKAVVKVGSDASQTLHFSGNCTSSLVPEVKPVAGIGAGTNNIHVELSDSCGGSESSTALYIVATYTPPVAPSKLHTTIEAESIAADVLPFHGLPVDLNALTLSARLTTVGGSPLDGKVVVFKNHGRTICADHTNSDGVASCFGLDKTLGALTDYTASFDGDSGYFGSSDGAGIATLFSNRLL